MGWPLEMPPRIQALKQGGAEEARRAHNAKVVGSNPTPATISNTPTVSPCSERRQDAGARPIRSRVRTFAREP